MAAATRSTDRHRLPPPVYALAGGISVLVLALAAAALWAQDDDGARSPGPLRGGDADEASY